MPDAPVLACVADNARGERVAQVAAEWAGMLGAETRLLHIAPDEAAAARARQRWSAAGRPIEAFARAGAVDRMICRRAREHGAQLVILGALEQDGVWTSLVGSVARRVARNASSSVLLLPHPEQASYGHVVASVGFDERSIALLRHVVRLANAQAPRRLDVLHEVESFGDLLRTVGERSAETAQRRQEHEADIHAQLNYVLRSAGLGELPVHVECLEGHAGQEGVEYARRVEADLLVVPAPPQLRVWDRFFKQPAELAMQNLPCALLLYRPQPEGKP
jgi:nucleotide-binding universal stress UspA family protein